MSNPDNSQPAQLDRLLHQPVRTRLVAYLAARDEASFTEIKKILGLTDGNLEAHMKKLVAADYIQPHKLDESPRSQTIYSLTESGRNAFRGYVQALEQLIALSGLPEDS
jgi:DNA-binding MarR family transcriptional regulator